jgi:G3E family GTPase
MNAANADLLPDILRPVTVLTGFLGSGKTTTLARLLKVPEFAGTVAIINEFGEIGLDHLLIETSEERFALLDNGCICCTVRDDLVRPTAKFPARRGRDHGTCRSRTDPPRPDGRATAD